MLVLGIDPGSRIAGWGLVEESNGRITAIDFGVVKPPATGDIFPRLKHIFVEFAKIVKTKKPSVLAVEDVFFAQNVRSALMLGQARSAAILPGLTKGLPVYGYSALQVKKALVGTGRAEKSQVAEMVRRICRMKEKPKPADVTDAIAVAICHLHTSPMMRRITAG